METENLSVAIAFVAGVLSFVSPCVLPLVPAYVSHLAGATIGEDTRLTSVRYRTFLHAAIFVLGFSVIFVALGASVGLVGYVFSDFVPLFRRLGGLVLVVLGLHTLGVIEIPLLYRDTRLEIGGGTRYGLVTSFIVGMTFAFGWTPCIGPILSAILLLASTTQTVAQGSLLLLAFSLGLGVPFLVTGLALSVATRVLKRLNKYVRIVSIVSGIFLIIMGIVFIFDFMSRFVQYFGYLGV